VGTMGVLGGRDALAWDAPWNARPVEGEAVNQPVFRPVLRAGGRLAGPALPLALAVLLGWASAAGAQDAGKSAAFKRAMADARGAMAERDLDAAKEHLKAGAAAAQSPGEQDELARLESLLDYLRQFWDLLSKGVAKLDAAEELVVGKTRVSFVEAKAGQIVLKVNGQIRRYTPKTIPTPLVMALAERSFAKDNVSKVVVGSFLAMDAKGDRKLARRLWNDAVRGGLHIAYLMPELDTGAVGGKPPVPTDEAKIQAAHGEVRQEYKHLYRRVGIPLRQEELIRKLLAAAPEVNDNPEKRFVMLRDARDLAAAAGESRLAADAIKELDRFFQIDALKMRLEVAEKLAAGARGLDASRDVVLQTLKLTEEAAKAGRLDEAEAAAKIAVAAARKTRSRGLVQQAAIAQRQVELLRKRRGAKP